MLKTDEATGSFLGARLTSTQPRERRALERNAKMAWVGQLRTQMGSTFFQFFNMGSVEKL